MVFSYNENGMLSRVDGFFYDKGSYTKLYMVRKVTYSSASSKNPQRIVATDAVGNQLSMTEYEYDNKKNPYFDLRITTGTVFPNNVVKMIVTSSNVTPSTETYTYTYTYNQDGYPTSSTYVNFEGSRVTTFAYDCK